VTVEIFFQNLNHRIYILEEMGVIMSYDDLTYISYIQDDWKMLQHIALEKKLFLEKSKFIWSHTVKINIEIFSVSIETFLEKYDQCGLKKIKDNLDLGLILMNVCKVFIIFSSFVVDCFNNISMFIILGI